MLLKQLPQERQMVKMRNEEMLLTPQSNRIYSNVAFMEEQWNSIKKQHLEHRSQSRSPARQNLESQLKNKVQSQCILKKVVPLSTINLAHMCQEQPRNHLKDSSHFQYIANKYSNIYRKQSPEQQIQRPIVNQYYQKNNLKQLDERARTNSYEKSLSTSSLQRKEPPQRKRVSQYQKSENSLVEQRNYVATSGLTNQRVLNKRKL